MIVNAFILDIDRYSYQRRKQSKQTNKQTNKQNKTKQKTTEYMGLRLIA